MLGIHRNVCRWLRFGKLRGVAIRNISAKVLIGVCPAPIARLYQRLDGRFQVAKAKKYAVPFVLVLGQINRSGSAPSVCVGFGVQYRNVEAEINLRVARALHRDVSDSPKGVPATAGFTGRMLRVHACHSIMLASQEAA